MRVMQNEFSKGTHQVSVQYKFVVEMMGVFIVSCNVDYKYRIEQQLGQVLWELESIHFPFGDQGEFFTPEFAAIMLDDFIERNF